MKFYSDMRGFYTLFGETNQSGLLTNRNKIKNCHCIRGQNKKVRMCNFAIKVIGNIIGRGGGTQR